MLNLFSESPFIYLGLFILLLLVYRKGDMSAVFLSKFYSSKPLFMADEREVRTSNFRSDCVMIISFTTSQVAILKPRLIFTLFYDIIYSPTFELYTPTLL